MLKFEVEEENLRAAHRAEIFRPLSAAVTSWAQLPVFTGQSDQRQEFVQGVVRSFSTHRLLAGPAGRSIQTIFSYIMYVLIYILHMYIHYIQGVPLKFNFTYWGLFSGQFVDYTLYTLSR